MPRPTSSLRWLLRAFAQHAMRASLAARRVLAPKRISASRRVGNIAESRAEAHLVAHGFVLRSRSAITRKGEADLLMQAPTGELVIVEVKSRVRSSDAADQSNAAAPELAMTRDKQHRLRGIARELAQRNPRERVRIDLVAIELDEQERVLAVRHYENVIRA